jgi:hypothetical protein
MTGEVPEVAVGDGDGVEEEAASTMIEALGRVTVVGVQEEVDKE